MKEYVKCDKFGKSCSYLTEGKVYRVVALLNCGTVVKILDDVSEDVFLKVGKVDGHTSGVWQFCEQKGDHLKTITICVEKTVRYNQEVQVTVDEYERLSNLNQDDLSKELTKLFDEDVAEVDDADIKVIGLRTLL